MAPAKPVQSSPARTITAKHLETVRNGNDDYTTTEYELEGDGKTWRTVGSTVLCERKTRNVTTDYVRDWWIQRAGRNGLGDLE